MAAMNNPRHAPEAPPSVATIDAARRGDEDAFRALFRAVQPGLVRYLRVLVGDEADDVASEAWLGIVRDLPRFSGDMTAFRAWSATIARNRAFDHLRAGRRRPSVSVDGDTLAALAAAETSGDDTERQALVGLSTDQAIALIRSLPRDQAEAVLLRVVLGLDVERTAQVLGKRSGAVRVAAHRGLRRLAGLLDERDQAVARETGERGGTEHAAGVGQRRAARAAR
jgi:RNA polymerase sigma-70 factor (ECF subfamily)